MPPTPSPGCNRRASPADARRRRASAGSSPPPAPKLQARRRPHRVASWPRATIRGRCRAKKGRPAHLVGARRGVGGVAELSRSHDSRLPATSTCGRAGVLAATSHPVGHRLAEATVGSDARCCGHRPVHEPAFGRSAWQPRAMSRRAQVDVADRSWRTLPRRFRETADAAACTDRVCGAPIFSSASRSIVASGWPRAPAERRPSSYQGSRAPPERRRDATGAECQRTAYAGRRRIGCSPVACRTIISRNSSDAIGSPNSRPWP